MDSNEQFVREAWEHVDSYNYRGLPNIAVCISFDGMLGKEHSRVFVNSIAGDSEAWSAAAEYTRAHLEELRCANQDYFSIEEQIDSNIEIIRTMDSIDAPFAVSLGEDLARLGRTLARLQAVRDDLKRGLVVDTQAHDKWHEGGGE